MTLAFDFLKDGVLVARGTVTAVCCRVLPDKSIEAVAIPEGLRERLLG